MKTEEQTTGYRYGFCEQRVPYKQEIVRFFFTVNQSKLCFPCSLIVKRRLLSNQQLVPWE